MKKILSISARVVSPLLLFFFTLGGFNAQAQGDAVNGKKLFNANCGACHKLDTRLLGPPMKGVTERRSKEWLFSWIKDNAALRESGDADAIAIFEEYNKIPMTAYSFLSDSDIEDILAYTDGAPAPEATSEVAESTGESQSLGDAKLGKKLFNSNCGACHKLDVKSIGPALSGVTDKRSNEWLQAWITDNAALRASGDEDAKAIYDEYKGIAMSAFAFLSEEDINNILAYTIEGDVKDVDVASDVVVAAGEEEEDYTLYILIALGVLFVLMLLVLMKMKNTLRAVQGLKAEGINDEVSGIWQAFAKNQFVVTLGTIVIAVFFLYQLYWYLMQLGVDSGYQPVQPIAYSHKVHAGDNEIDCNYCHSSARNSQTSGIPSANVCMNCHMMIDGSEIKENGELKYGGEKSPEIAKIYAAIGWDADNRKYLENHESKPIEWVRIHNLPDFVYFNHAQHVTAGGVECQTCHGPIETMEEVYQHSDLTMGWCIDCHRTTEVKVETNEYYAEFHDKLKEEYKGEKITVDKIGGLECGKCHY